VRADRLHMSVALALFVIMTGVYFQTSAPTISFWDSAEFVTCSVIMGIPHPPGSPLLALVGRVMSVLPFVDLRHTCDPSVAFNLNLVGVFSGALTVMLTYLIIVHLIRRISPDGNGRLGRFLVIFSAATAALMTGFGNVFWDNSVEIETYMPSLLLSMIAVWFTLRWEERANESGSLRYLFAASYILGLGNGVHLTVLLIAPTIVLLVIRRRPDWFRDGRLWGTLGAVVLVLLAARSAGGRPLLYGTMGVFALAGPVLIYRFGSGRAGVWKHTLAGAAICLALYGIGYSVYPTVMVRAAKNPAINEGNPDTWARFSSYLDREQYGQGSMVAGMFERKAPLDYQFGYMYSRYLLQQMPAWGPTFSMPFSRGQTHQRSVTPTTQFVPVSLLLWLIIALGLYFHLTRDTYRCGAFFMFFLVTSAGLVLYLNMNNPEVRERDYFFLGSFQILSIWLGMGLYGLLSGFRTALDRWFPGRGAIIVTVIFALVFATMVPVAVQSRHLDPDFTNYQVHDRSRNWIPQDYAINFLESCTPDAILFTNGDNDTFPLWFAREVLGVRRDVNIVNLSLLKAPWYIKQLRDEGRTLPIDYTDDFIDNRLTSDSPLAGKTRLWTPEAKEVTMAGLTWEMPPAVVGSIGGKRIGMLSVANIMVAHIIKQNNWERPLYFAVTVSPDLMIGLEEFLSMEGMVMRITKYRSPAGEYAVNADLLEHNLYDTFSFRGVTDSTLYKSTDTKGLLSNYAIMFIRLAEYYSKTGNRDGAARAAHAAIDVAGADRTRRLLLFSIMHNNGMSDLFEELIGKEMSRISFDDPETAMQAGLMFIVPPFDMKEPAQRVFASLVEKYPDNIEVLRGYSAVLFDAGKYTESLALVDRILERKPGDAEALQTRPFILERLEADTTRMEQ